MDVLTKARANNLMRTVVIPDALRRFRELCREVPEADFLSNVKQAGMEAIAANAAQFPAMNEEDGLRLVNLFVQLAEEAFADEYQRFIQPKVLEEEFVN
jgi:hypothetical protein